MSWLKTIKEIGEFILKRPFLTLLGGVAADEILLEGKIRNPLIQKAIKPSFDKIVDETKEKGLDFISKSLDKIGFGAIIGFGAGMLFSSGGIKQRLIMGVIFSAIAYLAQKHLFKNHFNYNAKDKENNYALEVKSASKNSAVFNKSTTSQSLAEPITDARTSDFFKNLSSKVGINADAESLNPKLVYE